MLLPGEIVDIILSQFFVGELPHTGDARAAQTVACLSAAWRNDASPRALACFIAQGGAPAWPYPILKWDGRVRRYTARNQTSTYEMLGRVARHYARAQADDEAAVNRATSRLDAQLRDAEVQQECGSYAGLNNWSPCCTAAQLRRLARRAHAAYAHI